jgi:hypothetical protein
MKITQIIKIVLAVTLLSLVFGILVELLLSFDFMKTKTPPCPLVSFISPFIVFSIIAHKLYYD